MVLKHSSINGAKNQAVDSHQSSIVGANLIHSYILRNRTSIQGKN